MSFKVGEVITFKHSTKNYTSLMYEIISIENNCYMCSCVSTPRVPVAIVKKVADTFYFRVPKLKVELLK